MNKKRNSAAIIGLLDAIKSEGIVPIGEKTFPDEENDSLKATRIIFDPIKNEELTYRIDTIDPKLCSVWNMANRLPEYINDNSCADLLDSIQTVGQQIPAIVRFNKEGTYEVICGARRLYVCKKLGVKLLAAIVHMNDQEALLAMDAENRPREDISPYERALDYSNWINKGFFASQNAIAEAIGFRKSWFSKLMSLSELDPAIVRAFKHPSELKQAWGYALYRLCLSSTEIKTRMISKAKEISGMNLSAEATYKQLISITEQNAAQAITRSYWVTNKTNKRIFKVQRNKSGKAQVIFAVGLSPQKVDKLITKLEKLVDEDY